MTKNIGWEPARSAPRDQPPLKGFGRRIVDLSLPLLLVFGAYGIARVFFGF